MPTYSTPRSILPDPQLGSDSSIKVPAAAAAAAIQQYSPLQQNYDRAVSPVVSLNQESAMSSQGLGPRNESFRARVDSPPHSLFDKGKGKTAATDNGYSSDDEADTVNSALKNMTVKSLQNLASYPNPNQKNAQKVLLRGTRPKASSSLGGGPSRLSTPCTYRNASPVEARISSSEEASIGYASFPSDPSATYQSAQNRRVRSRLMASEAGASGTYHSALESQLSTPSTNSDNTDNNNLASMHLASGPGAPKPLTAGPPGQRQYRPSTFESTFKALTTRSAAPQGFFTEAGNDHGPALGDDDSMSASMFPGAISVAPQSLYVEYEENPVTISSDTLLYLTINSDPDWSQEQKCTADNVYGCTCPAYQLEETRAAYSSIQRSGYSGPVGSDNQPSFVPPSRSGMHPADEEWDEPVGPMFPQCMGYPGRLTAREIERHNWRLNLLWYAGTGLLGDIDTAKALSPPVSHDVYPPVAKNIYGAVGEGRPSQAVQHGSAARRNSPWASRSMSFKSVDSDISDGLALLDQVLSRAS
ncbi:hypothetical protein V8C35DRAFT_291348, partial [Trichoderma chlorosporum]